MINTHFLKLHCSIKQCRKSFKSTTYEKRLSNKKEQQCRDAFPKRNATSSTDQVPRKKHGLLMSRVFRSACKHINRNKLLVHKDIPSNYNQWINPRSTHAPYITGGMINNTSLESQPFIQYKDETNRELLPKKINQVTETFDQKDGWPPSSSNNHWPSTPEANKHPQRHRSKIRSSMKKNPVRGIENLCIKLPGAAKKKKNKAKHRCMGKDRK